MKKYLVNNNKFWQTSYSAPNVENVIFRLQGRILSYEFNLPRKNRMTTALDFGCGQGATVNYLHQCGYDAYGVDISEVDINVAKLRYPHISHKFFKCNPDVFNTPITKFTDNKKISLITCQQSLYYFDKKDFNKLLKNFNRSLEPKGLLYSSMISTSHTYYKHSKNTDDDWLKEVNFSGKRFKIKNYYMFYCASEDDVVERFKNFKKIYSGSYHLVFDRKETNNHHYFILCKKK